MNKSVAHFQPVLLGSDFNVYGMARSFHEAYQIKSISLCSIQLAPIKYSKIIDVHILPNLDQENQFVQLLTSFYKKNCTNNCTYLLIPCGDAYAKLLSKFQDELKEMYHFSTIPFATYEKLENKATFYEVCQQFNIPYPTTVEITKNQLSSYQESIQHLPFSFPVVLKPSDSISYLPLQFEEKKKAYIIEDSDTLLHIIQKIYHAGYKESILIQDFIPGSDANMRVLNAYVDQEHQVRMMFLGNPILEDPSPANIGNYVAILPDFQPAIFENIQRLLTSINYTGFANFDLKFDHRDQQFKLFEINLRQGRSSFFVTLNGYNLAKYLVDDLILKVPFQQTELGEGNKLWLGAPRQVILRYLSDNSLKTRVKQYISHHQYGTTIFYKKDISIRHFLLQCYTFFRYRIKFRKNFKRKID
jgi:D-aspartate ligase